MQKLIISPLFLLGFSPLLQAQDEISETTLSPITVTATRTEQDTKLVSSTVIKRSDIERLQVNSVEEALRGIAGINISNNGGLGKTTSVFLRGTNADHVLVLIDGVRVGSATTGTTSFENLPINEIDSIEVIRGPKSSLYGSEALGGVIHIHTRKGANTAFKPTLSASIGSHNHYRYSGGVSGQVDNSWYNLNLTHEQTQGFDAKSDGLTPDHDGYNNHAASLRLGHKFSQRLSLEAHALYAAGQNEFDISPNAWSSGDEFAKNTYIQQVFGGQIKFKPADFWNMTFKAGESRDRYKDQSIYAGIFDTKRLSLSFQNDFTLAENQLLTLGYDYLADTVSSTESYAESERDNHAGFIQYLGQFDQHSVTLGFRDDHNQQFGHHATWNAAYGYTFANDITVSASYGTAYKAPTFNELYYPNFGNDKLKPEGSSSYEIGVNGKHDWGSWSINHYQTYIKDLIVLDSNWQPNNISQARIRGLEAMARTNLFGFDVQANLSLLNPQNKSYDANAGKLLPRRAEQVFRLDVDKRFNEFSAGASFRAEGRRFDDIENSKRLAGFATLDLRAEYTLLKQLTLQAKVNNILNKQYQTAAGYNTDDLNVFFTLRYSPNI